MRKTKGQRISREADQTAFIGRLERALENRPYFLPSNIRPPKDYNFAQGVLTGYVAGLRGE